MFASHILLISVISGSFLPESSINNKDLAISAGSLALFGCLKTGIGAAFNEGNFVRGCAYGVVGSLPQTAGNYFVSNATQYKGFGAIGKISNDIGISIQDNILRGNAPFSSFTTDISFVSVTIGKDWGFKYNATPIVGLAVFSLKKNISLNWRESLYNLTPVYNSINSFIYGNYLYSGLTLGNTVSYSLNTNRQGDILGHELIHTLQWSRMRSAFYLGGGIPFISDIQNKGYWNLSRDIISNSLYGISGINRDFYYNNPLELEAYAWEKK